MDTENIPVPGTGTARALLAYPRLYPGVVDPVLFLHEDLEGRLDVGIASAAAVDRRSVIITRPDLVEFLATCGLSDDHNDLRIDGDMRVSIMLTARVENAAKTMASAPKAGSKTPERLADIREWATQELDFTDRLLPFKLLMMLREVLGDFLPQTPTSDTEPSDAAKLAVVRNQLFTEHLAAVEAGDAAAEARAASLIFMVDTGRRPEALARQFEEFGEHLHDMAGEELQGRAEEYADSLEDFSPYEY